MSSSKKTINKDYIVSFLALIIFILVFAITYLSLSSREKETEINNLEEERIRLEEERIRSELEAGKILEEQLRKEKEFENLIILEILKDSKKALKQNQEMINIQKERDRKKACEEDKKRRFSDPVGYYGGECFWP